MMKEKMCGLKETTKGRVFSIQGCMAVGKTSALRYVKRYAPEINVSYEDNEAVISKIRERKLVKTRYEDYLEIQRLWLMKEVERWEKAQAYACTLMDFGAEEIEFYTLNYPKSIGEDWDVETPLKTELEAVRRCMPERILFLNASDDTLQRRREQDQTRSRTFFPHYLSTLWPLKKKWLLQRKDVDVLETDALSVNEVGERVLSWLDERLTL